MTTPQGSGATEQSSLRTIPSISTVTERDVGRDIDRLVDEIRVYDQARGLEHQDLEDNVGALRDELQRLADYLRRTPSPVLVYRTPSPGPPVLEETPRRRIQLTDQAVGIARLSPQFIQLALGL